MRHYHVNVAVRILETYRVEAEDADTAEMIWDEGELIGTDDEALDTEVLTVVEVRP